MMMAIQRFLCVKNTQLFLKSFSLQWKQVDFLPKCHFHFWKFSPLLITIQHFFYFWNTFFIEFLLIPLMLCFRKSLLFENAAFWTFWWWIFWWNIFASIHLKCHSYVLLHHSWIFGWNKYTDSYCRVFFFEIRMIFASWLVFCWKTICK